MPKSWNRRGFLSTTALGTGASLVSVGCGRPAASERVSLGCIGLGMMGAKVMRSFLHDPRVQVVAVCDVNRESNGYWHNEVYGREPARRVVDDFYGKAWNRPKGSYKACRAFVDYREMLDKADCDAVLISTPNHWHGLQAVDALESGVHVYGQKPLARTIAEGREICNAVREAGRVWQTGSQQRSDQYFRRACELVRNGRIGDVVRVEIGLPGGNPNYSRRGKEREMVPIPEGFDFERWLGPAPSAPYSPARTHANWRWLWDYAGGNITDFGAHHLDIALWGLGMERDGPKRVCVREVQLPGEDDFYETATRFRFEAEMPGGIVIDVRDTKHHDGLGGVKFVGEDGRWIWCDRGEFRASSRELTREHVGEGETRLHVSTNHEEDFVDAILSGRGKTVAPVEAAQRAISIAHLANVAIRLGQTEVAWDAAKERVTGEGAEQAMALVSQPRREGW